MFVLNFLYYFVSENKNEMKLKYLFWQCEQIIINIIIIDVLSLTRNGTLQITL